MSKTYTVEESCINVTGGRYKSNSPLAAAKKAATKLFKKAQSKPSSKSLKKISFCIRETTSGSDKKLFAYVATRVKLAQPLVRVINGVEIVNRFKTEVKADKSAKAVKPEKKPKATKTAKKAKSPSKPKAAKATKATKATKASKSPKKPRAKKVKAGCGCNKD
jgi:hypothetical protein